MTMSVKSDEETSALEQKIIKQVEVRNGLSVSISVGFVLLVVKVIITALKSNSLSLLSQQCVHVSVLLWKSQSG